MTDPQIRQLKEWLHKNVVNLSKFGTKEAVRQVAHNDLGFEIPVGAFHNHYYDAKHALRTPEQGVDVRIKRVNLPLVEPDPSELKGVVSDTLAKLVPTIRALENRPDSKDLEGMITHQSKIIGQHLGTIALQTKIIEQLKASATSKEVSLMQIINDQKTEILSLRKTIEELETEVYSAMSAPKIAFKLNY